jgi:two-component system, chemotaxis family, sensor kinase CheA
VTPLDPRIVDLARQEAHDSLEAMEQSLLALESGAAGAEAIDAVFRAAHSIKGTAGMVGWDEAAAIAHVLEDRLDECRTGASFPAELAGPMLRATDALRQAIDGDPSGAPPVLEELATLAPAADAPPAGRAKEAPRAPDPRPARAASGRAIRVAAEKVDRMLDAVGESVLHHRRLQHQLGERIGAYGDGAAEEELDRGERLLEELQDSVIAMRTLPLSSITAPFPRAVRDMAASEGKEVELVITGADTQLDRVILEGISETITHLLRNAVAHGIETPDEREPAGKPRGGRVELRAEQRGALIAIEVADDGRGVAPELVARVDHGESLADVLAGVGFSTASEVSGLAGRGVGLDAVKTNVERLSGSLEVLSEPGRGTRVVMLLPLTLALLRVLICERDGQVFGLPLASVREVVEVAETSSLAGRRSLELRGESIPVADLASILGAAAPPLAPAPPALVVRLPVGAVAIACDRVLGDHDVVTKSIGRLLADVPGYLGAAILEDGRVALILDPRHVARSYATAAALDVADAGSDGYAAPRVLVVDDQFTVRELQRSILETAGYSVELAEDGRRALERIARRSDIDIVLTDLEMPEMDGFELLGAIRRDQEHSALPVVIVTSRGDEDDRRRGVEEGADAYIVKDEFDQQTLLGTIRRLVGP